MDDVVRWLVHTVPRPATAPELLHGFATRLNASGLELLRINVQLQPLSPQVGALLHVWRQRPDELEAQRMSIVDVERLTVDGAVIDVATLHRSAFETEAFRVSPLYRVLIHGEREVRRVIPRDGSELEFPIFRELQAQGGTGYLAVPLPVSTTTSGMISFVTRAPGGFTDAQVAALHHVAPVLGLAMAPLAEAFTLRALLGAYLGPKTADRVLAGKIDRGDSDEIQAAIWFSDLRGFTPLSSSVPPRTLIDWLDDYFEVVARAIHGRGGEILKLIGDAVLAVWPVDDAHPIAATCREALAAAHDANRALDELNARRAADQLPPLAHGIGLHLGDVLYGNIGAHGRLDFTVIGPAVNLASRLEGACARLGRRIVASAELARHCDGLEPAGEVELKGVAGAVEVFTA